VNPIRPSVLPPTPQGSSPQDSAKLAAQRAFFAAAMGQAQAQAPAATIQPTSPAATTAARAAPAPAEAPQKILRPGSLIDIRV
jgi:hypothetical protein